jgi:hypothetical protein
MVRDDCKMLRFSRANGVTRAARKPPPNGLWRSGCADRSRHRLENPILRRRSTPASHHPIQEPTTAMCAYLTPHSQRGKLAEQPRDDCRVFHVA